MASPLGAVSYIRAHVETVEQARERGLDIGTIVHATGSGGTQAGLVVGAKALGLEVEILGISVSDERNPFSRLVLEICRRTEEALELERRVEADDVEVLDGYLGRGYGVVDESVARTVTSLLREEALILDPVYTAKAMTGLEDLARRGRLPRDRAVVFYHTGGAPALFPHRRALLDLGGGPVLSGPRSTSGT
jgi:1-aminocyclopropane-1-carboxylate deaminase/D-cysteine desulfhydrase-like pyridoxal-dependent ACC family enzyme